MSYICHVFAFNISIAKVISRYKVLFKVKIFVFRLYNSGFMSLYDVQSRFKYSGVEKIVCHIAIIRENF